VREPHREVARGLRQRQTPAEQRLWLHLRGGQLDGRRFRRQQPIGPYIADFYCAAAKLVVEVDGPIHERQVEYDRERDAYLAAHDLRVLRFTNQAVLYDLDTVLRAILHAIAPP
jgi:very-short-patch-repair endonuclease